MPEAACLTPDAETGTRRHAQRLLDRIHRRYQTKSTRQNIGRLSFTFTRIADPDRVLNEVAEEVDLHQRLTGNRTAEPLHLPYWAELWDSATGIAQRLAAMWGGGGMGAVESMDEVITGAAGRRGARPSLLDLGCGMGLAGTAAAALGARVMFADIEPPALLFAQLNSLPWRRRVRARRVDWQIDRLGERFDVIVGADILYERPQWASLEPFWRNHLQPGGTIILGEPGRQTGDLFLDWIVGRGWDIHRSEEPVPTRERPIRILELSRKL